MLVHRDRQHPHGDTDIRGIAQGHLAVKGADGRETKVAGCDVVAAILFERIEESENNIGVQLLNREVGGFDASFLVHETQQQAEGVAIAGERFETCTLLGHKIIREEDLQKRSNQPRRGHPFDPPSLCCLSNSAAAVSNSSGVSVTYQYVFSGPEWPR